MKFLGSQKLYSDFQVHERSVPLTTTSFEGQRYLGPKVRMRSSGSLGVLRRYEEKSLSSRPPRATPSNEAAASHMESVHFKLI